MTKIITSNTGTTALPVLFQGVARPEKPPVKEPVKHRDPTARGAVSAQPGPQETGQSLDLEG